MNPPIYVFFGIWPEARLWAREFGVAYDDIVMAAQPVPKLRRRVGDRRVIFVRTSSYPLGPNTLDQWKAASAWCREHNAAHDWVTEVREF